MAFSDESSSQTKGSRNPCPNGVREEWPGAIRGQTTVGQASESSEGLQKGPRWEEGPRIWAEAGESPSCGVKWESTAYIALLKGPGPPRLAPTHGASGSWQQVACSRQECWTSCCVSILASAGKALWNTFPYPTSTPTPASLRLPEFPPESVITLLCLKSQ